MTTGRINQVAVRTWVGSRRGVRRRPTGPEFNGSGTTRFLEFECGGTLVNWQTFPSVLVFSGFCTEKHSHGERSPPLRLLELWYGHSDHWTRKQSCSRDLGLTKVGTDLGILDAKHLLDQLCNQNRNNNHNNNNRNRNKPRKWSDPRQMA